MNGPKVPTLALSEVGTLAGAVLTLSPAPCLWIDRANGTADAAATREDPLDALPDPGEPLRGVTAILLGGDGEADQTALCLRDATGAFGWYPVALGPVGP